jgi:hypothetical protein
MTDTAASLGLLRRQVAALLSEIDTATLPRPDKQRGPRDRHPGCEWNPRKGWKMFTIEEPDCAGMVYLDHGCDDIRYGWPVDGDWESLRVEDARAIGLAFLAVAARADQLFEGVTRLPEPVEAVSADPAGPDASVRPIRKRTR